MTCIIDTENFEKAFFEKIRVAENKISLSDKDGKSKDVSLCGRVLLGYMLKREFDMDFFCYRYGENDKPYLKDEDIFFNISHSGNMVLCSVERREVGCDVQKLSEYKPGIVGRFFTEKEFALIEGCEDKSRIFTKLWALKESILKQKGTGIGGGLSAYDFSAFTDSDDFTAYGLRFSCFSLKGYEIAVCTEIAKQSLELISREEFERYIDSIKI